MKTKPKPDVSTLEPLPGNKGWEVHSPKKWCFEENIKIPTEFESRTGRLTLEGEEYWLTFPATAEDKGTTYEGWTKPTRTKYAKRVWESDTHTSIEFLKGQFEARVNEDGVSLGYWYKSLDDGIWYPKSQSEAMNLLLYAGLTKSDAMKFMGELISTATKVVYVPFEEPKPRRGVRNMTRSWLVKSAEGPTPNIDASMRHIGQAFDQGVKDNEALADVGITTGYQYLMTWLAWVIQRPQDRLPYLYLYSAGKMHGKDFIRNLLMEMLHTDVYFVGEITESGGGWTDHEQAIAFLFLSEVGIHGMTPAKFRYWVDMSMVPVAKRHQTKVLKRTYRHAIHTSNHFPDFIEPGDTRCTIGEVPPLPKIDPNYLLKCEPEREAFRHKLENWPLPDPIDRCGIPALMNDIKVRVMTSNAERSNQTRELLGEDTSGDIPDAVAAALEKLANANGGSVELRPHELHERSGAPMTYRKFIYVISEPEFVASLSAVGVSITKSKKHFADTKQTQTIYTVTHTMDKPAMGGA